MEKADQIIDVCLIIVMLAGRRHAYMRGQTQNVKGAHGGNGGGKGGWGALDNCFRQVIELHFARLLPQDLSDFRIKYIYQIYKTQTTILMGFIGISAKIC